MNEAIVTSAHTVTTVRMLGRKKNKTDMTM